MIKVDLTKDFGEFKVGETIEVEDTYKVYMKQFGTIRETKAEPSAPQNKSVKPEKNK